MTDPFYESDPGRNWRRDKRSEVSLRSKLEIRNKFKTQNSNVRNEIAQLSQTTNRFEHYCFEHSKIVSSFEIRISDLFFPSPSLRRQQLNRRPDRTGMNDDAQPQPVFHLAGLIAVLVLLIDEMLPVHQPHDQPRLLLV